jgi:hypothetical protein
VGAEIGQGVAPGVTTAVGQRVVGPGPLDGGDAELGEVCCGATQEPGAGCGGFVGNFDGAATTVRTPPAANCRANPNPVGPASYAAAAGPGNRPSQSSTADAVGAKRCRTT